MSVTEEFRAKFTVDDRTGAALRQIGQRFARVAQQSGLVRLAGQARQLGGALAGVGATLTRVAAPIAAIGATAAGAGVATLASRAATLADDLGDLSARTGIAIADLQSYGDVAQRTGASQEVLADSLQRLNRGMVDAANGGNRELAAIFRRLRIPLRNANGQLRNSVDLLPELADAFAANENPAVRTRLAMELFGRQGAALIPMLAEGSAELRRGQERWRRYGYDMTAAAQGATGQAFHQFRDLATAIEGLGLAIGVGLAPVLGPIASQMADWVKENRQWIASGITQAVTDLSETLRGFFRDRGPMERMEDLRQTISGVVESVGGLRNVLIAFGALAAAPFIASVVSIAANLVPIIAAAGKVALALGAGSPIGLAVIAFAASAALIYNRWGDLSDFFSDLWERVSKAFGDGIAAVQRGFGAIADGMRPQVEEITRLVTGLGSALVAPLRRAWEPIRRFFDDLWDGIVGRFERAWEAIKAILDRIPSLPSLAAPTTPIPATPQQQERSGRWGQRGLMAPGLQSPIQPQSFQPGRVERDRVEVSVDFRNTPPGTRVETESRGTLGVRASTSVGYAMQQVPALA